MNTYKDFIIHQKPLTANQENRVLLLRDGQYYETSTAGGRVTTPRDGRRVNYYLYRKEVIMYKIKIG